MGNVDERAMHRYKQDSSHLGKSSFAFAWILDESEEERSRGVTMVLIIFIQIFLNVFLIIKGYC